MSLRICYIRSCVGLALTGVEFSGPGQLEALAQLTQVETGHAVRRRVANDERPPEIYHCPETRRRSVSRPLITPIDYQSTSWRRAVLVQEPHRRAWLHWIYAGDSDYAHQVAIVSWGWDELNRTLETKRLARKTRATLKNLTWLAAQEVRAGLTGRGKTYATDELRVLAGVNRSTWAEVYNPHWQELKHLFSRLDIDSLTAVDRARSEQKTAFFTGGIAKPNKTGYF